MGRRLRLELQMARNQRNVCHARRLQALASPGSQHGAEPAETMGQIAVPTVPPPPPGEPAASRMRAAARPRPSCPDQAYSHAQPWKPRQIPARRVGEQPAQLLIRIKSSACKLLPGIKVPGTSRSRVSPGARGGVHTADPETTRGSESAASRQATVLSSRSGPIGVKGPPQDTGGLSVHCPWLWQPSPAPARFCKPQQNKSIIKNAVKPSFLLSTKSSNKVKMFLI